MTLTRPRTMIRCLFAGMLVLLPLLSARAAEPTTRPIEIEVAINAGAESIGPLLECAREYERLRPGIKVNLYGDLRISDKIQMRILEGRFPEIINSVENIRGLIRAGYVMPLDEVLDDPEWDGSQGGQTWRQSFLPGSLDRYNEGGRTYGVPLAYFTQCIWYNKALFQKHGWKPPTTWDEFFSLCEKIKATGVWPMAFQGRYPLYALRLIESVYFNLAGRERYDAQRRLRPGEYDNPEMVEAFRLTQHLATNYFQPGCMGMSHTEAELQLFLGRAAMVSSGSWLVAEMEGKIPADFQIGAFNFPLPGGKGDAHALSATGGYFWIFQKSPHPREAADFLRFLTAPQTAARFCRHGLPMAVRGVNRDNLPPRMGDIAEMLETSTQSYGGAAGEQYPDMTQRWIDLIPPLLTGTITPEAAAHRLEQDAAAVRQRTDHPGLVTVRHRFKPAMLAGIVILAGAVWVAGMVRRFRTQRRQPGQMLISAGRLRMSRAGLLLFLGPPILLYGVFVIIPSARSLPWSFYEWDGLTTRVWCGMLNFKRLLFESDPFWIALSNNIFLMVVVPLFVLPLSLFLATCLSRRLPGWKFFRIAFFFPNVLGSVAVALLWMHLYNPQGGLLNSGLIAIGKGLTTIGLGSAGQWFTAFEGFPWLASQNLYWSLIPMLVWGSCGFNMILFLAAMEGIPPELYESAEIDGASPWRQFWSITMPLIWEVMTIALVFMVIGGMKTFESIWLLTNQLPTTQTHVIGTRIIQAMFTEFRVGEATAIAVVLFIMVLVGTSVTLNVMRRREAVEM